MIAGLPDPFDALLRLQRELEGRRTSEWLEDTTSGSGAYPPINVFQQGHDFVAIVELPGVGKSDLEIQAKETPSRSRARNRWRMASRSASTGGSG